MLDGPRLDDELLHELGDIDGIEEVEFHPECTTQGKPAVLVLVPTDSTSVDALEDIGVKVRKIMSEVLDGLTTDVSASIEHPVTAVVDEDDNVTGLEPVEEEHVVKLRYRQKTVGRISATRLNGYAIGPGLPGEQSDS